MNIKKKILDVLYQDDLEEFLITIGLSNDFKEGKIKCSFCNETINYDNICALMQKIDKFIFICNRESCYENYLKLNKALKNGAI